MGRSWTRAQRSSTRRQGAWTDDGDPVRRSRGSRRPCHSRSRRGLLETARGLTWFWMRDSPEGQRMKEDWIERRWIRPYAPYPGALHAYELTPAFLDLPPL